MAAVAAPAHAHFRLNSNIRIIHLERLADGIQLSMRLPATLAYAEYANLTDDPPRADTIPWVVDAVENGEQVHYLDRDAIAQDVPGFSEFIASGYRLTADDTTLHGVVTDLRIHEASRQTRFTTRDEVNRSFAKNRTIATGNDLYVGDAVVDIRIRYPAQSPDVVLRISNILPSKIPDDTFIANLLIGYSGDDQQINRVTGQLSEPVDIAPTRYAAIKSFLRYGFGHILTGPDHLLFVLCLAIGAGSLTALLWRVTGFTIGHSLSLSAGIAGYAPQQPWLIYLVEVMIAASIIYAAILVLRKTSREYTILVTTMIGVLHGFGFSFLLSDLLGMESPHLVTSLLSFNLGIELGQVLVVMVICTLLFALGRISQTLRLRVTNAVASVSLVVAFYWVLQRAVSLLEVA